MKKNRFALGIIVLTMLALVACGHTSGIEASSAGNSAGRPGKKEIIKDQPIVYFSEESGFYDKEFELSLECPVEGAKIYYTIDGSAPTNKSAEYTQPIKLKNRTSENNNISNYTGIARDSDYIPDNVNKANIVRAIAYFEDGTCSKVTCGTFFVGLDRQKLYGNTPVISLVTDNENFYDYETGIYILGKTYDEWLMENPSNAGVDEYLVVGNYSNKGREWERPVYFEYIDETGLAACGIDMGIRIKGAASRSYYQKSFKLISRKEYEAGSVKYDLIPGNERSDGNGYVDSYKTFVLRNGGNDCAYAKFRDPYLQSLVTGRSFDTQQSVPCVVFINGEYWGCYTLTEDYSDDYFEENYGIDKDNIVVVKRGEIEEGTDEDIELFDNVCAFITENDMSKEADYKKAGELIDITGFAEYAAFVVYTYNHDSFIEDNNWSVWRTRQADNATAYSDGKWRFLLYDTEFSTGIYTEGNEYTEDTVSRLFNAMGNPYKGKLFAMFCSLYENNEFKSLFVNSLCDMRNYDFEARHAVDELNKFAEEYKLLMPESIRRNGPYWVTMYQDPAKYYEGKVSELSNFMDKRYSHFPGILQGAMGLGATYNVNITVDEVRAGTVKINNTMLDYAVLGGNTFTGEYFGEYAITLTAIPYGGYEFVEWSIEGADVPNSDSKCITVKLTQDCNITAIYAKK